MQYHLKKSLGQHFLHDDDLCRRVVASLILPENEALQLLEVGPGAGAITRYLLALPGVAFKAVEVDEEKVVYLQHTFPAIRGKLIHADVLKMERPFDGPFAVIGNFPYNISSQILFRVLEWKDAVTQVVGMFQKEVAQRIAAGPGTKDYGILSVLLQAHYRITYLFDVPPEAFTPPPKVMSGVIRLQAIGNPFDIRDSRAFTRLVKAAFGQRRKVLSNALKGTLPPEALSSEPLMSKRAEQLSVEDFAGLYQRWMLAR